MEVLLRLKNHQRSKGLWRSNAYFISKFKSSSNAAALLTGIPIFRSSRRPMLRNLGADATRELDPGLRDPVDYRKSGLSLNHVIGCPLDCKYCVRHLFGNFEMKVPHTLMSDEEAVSKLVGHKYFRPHITPLQIFNRATDPLLPGVKSHLFRCLELLDGQGLTNHLLVISRWKLDPQDCEALNNLRNLKLSLLFTWSGIDDKRVEPVDSGVAATSLETAYNHSKNYRVVLYWRPLVPGLNDTPSHLRRLVTLSSNCHAIAFTGLFFREQIQEYYKAHDLPLPFDSTARRKILPAALEQLILTSRELGELKAPIFRKTSCAVSYSHGQADYNGHYGIRELCDICPTSQVGKCRASFASPTKDDVESACSEIGLDQPFQIDSRAVTFPTLSESDRYFIQHQLKFQVHNEQHPHYHGRHGRADIGWEEALAEDKPE